MSWLERINNVKLKITTGDGMEYYPLWKESRKSVNYNSEGYNFRGIKGTYVERQELLGRQFPVILFFQGDNCIEIAEAFDKSLEDKRPCTIEHPYYESVKVQPVEFEFDASNQNQVKATGVFWETIDIKYPQETLSPVKDIEAKKSALDETVSATFVDDVETPEYTAIEKARRAIAQIGTRYESLTTDVEIIQELKNGLRLAESAATELLSAPTRFINDVINLINYPFLIKQNIEGRLNALLNSVSDLANIFLPDEQDGIVATTTDKLIWQATTSTVLSETARNIVNTKESDYPTRSKVLSKIQAISTAYYSFITESDNQDINQDKQVAIDLDYIMQVSFAYLYDIAFNSKQERTYTLDKDDNLINMAHRFVGPGDTNLELFISQNNITLDEYLQLKKGRKIIYYV